MRRFLATLSPFTFAIVALASVVALSGFLRETPLRGGDAKEAVLARQPVEALLSKQMRYLFALPYERLRQGLKQEPADRSAWRVATSDALILSESANLLIAPSSKGKSESWMKQAVAVRQSGSRLYQAAQKREYEESLDHYDALIDNCNACHQESGGFKIRH